MLIPRPPRGIRWILAQTRADDGLRRRSAQAGEDWPAVPGKYGHHRQGASGKRVFVGRHINDDYERYIGEPVRNWNYTEERARKLDPGVMEWMAVPFYGTDRQRVEGVLFLESTTRGFFTPDRQEHVLAAVRGRFIGKRYT